MHAVDEDEAVDYEALPEHYNRATHMMAGAMAGVAEHALIYPIDTIKTRMQVLPVPASVTLTAATRHVHETLGSAMRTFVSTEGVRGLWRGIASVFISAGPAHALHFATYEELKVRFGYRADRTSVLATGMAGACATIVHDTVMTPFDVLKQRMQLGSTASTACGASSFALGTSARACSSAADPRSLQALCAKTLSASPPAATAVRYRSLRHCFELTLRQEGARAFFLSLPTTLMMNIPFHAMHFSVYEFMRQQLLPVMVGEQELERTGAARVYSPATHVISGAVAGGIAAWLTVPLDVTKTLLQTRGLSACAEIRGCDSAVKAWRLLYRREGVRAFFRGSRARVLAHMPATAISWSMYEYFKFALGRFHESSAVYGEVLNNGGGDNHAPRDNDRDLAAVGSAPASAPVSH